MTLTPQGLFTDKLFGLFCVQEVIYLKNPWEDIPLSDYESHMSSENVFQLQTLSQMMKEQFSSDKFESIMILGIAGGNGLEHINKEQVNKVYGVDVNQSYLDECVKRYSELNGVLETICADLLDDGLQLPYSQLLVANLLIEYIGYSWFQRVVMNVKPKYVSCIIQINSENSFVSDSPYLHSFDCLEKVHHQMEEEALINCMREIDYRTKEIKERALPNGKRFLRIDFVQ